MSKKKNIPRWTTKQREWIKRRDNYQCQFIDLSGLEPVVCHKQGRLECHHITPFNWAKRVLRWKEYQVNSPENAILLCWHHHQEILHPDYGLAARKLYRYDEESYRLIASRHEQMARAKIPYWYQGFDGLLKMIAKARTREYKKLNPKDIWPDRGGKQ